jgi:hypothetical protein
MKGQREILERHVESMRARLAYLDKALNIKRSANGGDVNQLSLSIQEAGDQVLLLAANIDRSYLINRSQCPEMSRAF